MGTLNDGFQIMLAEIVGTGLLIILGDGVVAGVLLTRSKAQNSGWIVITTGWALGVAFGVYAIGSLTGAHLNPAVTIGFAATGFGGLTWDLVPWYIVGEMIGAFLGAVIVYLHYLRHWAETDDPGLKLAVFSTGPAIRSTGANVVSEVIGTFMLVFGVMAIVANELAPGFVALLVGFLVWSIGLSLGGPTGYAINPARDLGPRIAHAVLPIAGKGTSDWEYSWIPVVGPIIGGVLGGVAYQAIFTNFLMA
ncbi:MAG: MIP/aquaporin family protein [Candidatus Limnocylindria bacterium]